MKKIYVACPAFLATGGTELLHQLVKRLSEFNSFKTYLFYCNYDVEREKPQVPERFLKYVEPEQVVHTIEDDDRNMLIVPEVLTTLLPKYSSLKKVIWWLSVNNFFLANRYRRISIGTNIKYNFKRLFNIPLTHYEETIYNVNPVLYHLYQSEYARSFLSNRNIKNVLPLSDFLNDTFFESLTANVTTQKQDIVAYNPVKGFRFTKKLINNSRGIKYVPIQNMTATEVASLLASAKVYIDFGYHPGKDRIPREAVLNGCCIITGMKGAAANDYDIPIDPTYKFRDVLINIPRIVIMIKAIFLNYESHTKNFDHYREIIRGEKEKFEKDLALFLQKSNFIKVE